MVQLRKYQLNYYITWVSYILILYLSLMQVPENVPETINIGDKWAHFLMYGFLSTMAVLDVLFHKERTYNLGKIIQKLANKQTTFKLNYKYGWVYPSLWGVLMECVQGMTSYRSFSFWDMLANLIGTTFAYLLIAIALRLLNNKQTT